MDATNQPVFEQEGQAKIIEHLSRKNGGDRPPLCARCWQPVERRTNTQQAWKAHIMGKSPTPASTFRKARVAQYRDGSPNPEARVLGGVLTRGAIERALSGREATEADKATRRVRILPLHSIGHSHSDCPFRRLLVEIPPNCPLRADDRAWAFSGLPITGEISGNLVRTDERGILDHYGVFKGERSGFRVWRTITPAALPNVYSSPSGRRAGPRATGAKRVADEAKAAHAVKQALRHVGVPLRTLSQQH